MTTGTLVRGIAAASALLVVTPVHADDGAAIGLGIAGMVVGAMAAAAAQQQQRRYYYQQRRYVRTRSQVRYARAAPRHVAAHHVVEHTPRSAGRTPEAATIKVTTDTPWMMPAWRNCTVPKNVSHVEAYAEHGFLKERYTTEYQCGDPQHLVKQFVYLSPSGYAGPDRIVYSEGGRVKSVTNVVVGDYGKQYDFEPNVEANNREELYLTTIHGCGDVDVRAEAKKGFASVRETSSENSDKCGRQPYIEKRVYFRSLDDFEGQDTVTVHTSFRSPLVYNVAVTGPARDPEPKVSSSSHFDAIRSPVKATEAVDGPADDADTSALAKMLNDRK